MVAGTRRGQVTAGEAERFYRARGTYEIAKKKDPLLRKKRYSSRKTSSGKDIPIITPKEFRIVEDSISKRVSRKQQESYIQSQLERGKTLRVTTTEHRRVRIPEKISERKKIDYDKKPEFYSPERAYLQKYPDTKVRTEAKFKRYYDDKEQIIGLGDPFAQQSYAAPADKIFKESAVKQVELLGTAGIELSKKADLIPRKSRDEQVIEKGVAKTGESIKGLPSFNMFEAITGKEKASEIREKAIGETKAFFGFVGEAYKKAEPFVIGALDKVGTKWERGASFTSGAEPFIAENILVMAKGKDDQDFSFSGLLGSGVITKDSNFESVTKKTIKDIEIVPISKTMSDIRPKVLEWNVAQIADVFEDTKKPKSLEVAEAFGSSLVLGAVDTSYFGTKKPITTAAFVGGGVLLVAASPTIAAAAFTGLSIYDYSTRPTIGEKISAVVFDIILGGVVFGAEKIGVGLTKLSSKYKHVETDVFGVRRIEDVMGKKGIIDIDLVPAGHKGIDTLPKIDIDPARLLKDYDIPLRQTPVLPKTTRIQSRILDVLKREDIKFSTETYLGGSFAQETLLKKGRGFGDLDILSSNPSFVASKLKDVLGDSIKVKKQTITDSPLGQFDIYKVAEVRRDGSYRHVADIDPLRFAEEGFAKDFGSSLVDGVPVADIRSRFIAKSQQFGRGKRTDKVIADVGLLSGGDVTLTGQKVRGGFGFSFEEQAIFVGKTGDVASGQRDLFGLFTKQLEVRKPNAEGLKQTFFGSPWDIDTGAAQLRVSRLGTSKASVEDLFSGGVSFGKSKPQALIFEQTKVADIPFELKGIYTKAIGGDVAAQTRFLEEFKSYQLAPSKKPEFLPFGYGGGEAELTYLGVIKKKGTIAVTVIDGKRVPIFSTELVASSPELKALQLKGLREGLDVAESRKAFSLLEQESGGLLSSRATKPYIDIGEVSALGIAGVRATSPLPSKSIGSLYSPSVSLVPSFGVSSPLSLDVSPSIALSGRVSSPISKSVSPIGYSFPISSIISPSPKPSVASPIYSPEVLSPVSPSHPPPISPPFRRTPKLSRLRLGVGSKEVDGYNAYVKRKRLKEGKGSYFSRGYEKVNEVPISRGAALVAAGSQVDRYTNRSFIVKPSGSKVINDPFASSQWDNLRGKFRVSKKNKNVFVEKSLFAIDSYEEKQGIPFEAARQRRKDMFSIF